MIGNNNILKMLSYCIAQMLHDIENWSYLIPTPKKTTKKQSFTIITHVVLIDDKSQKF